jgi:hypothetical protein
MATRDAGRAARTWRWVLAACVATALAGPASWVATRPPESRGAPVAEALGGPASAGARPAPATGPAPPSPPVAPPDGGPAPAVGPPGSGRASAAFAGTTLRDASLAAWQRVPAPPPPVRVELPRLGVDAPVDPTGTTADGLMELPEDVARVGWYRHGPAPGEDGSVVLAGHVDSREQGLGELHPLRRSAPGDEVLVTDAAGAVARYRVVAVESLPKERLPLDRLFARSGPSRLVLVTCGGPFLAERGAYRDNVVVVAEPGG